VSTPAFCITSIESITHPYFVYQTAKRIGALAAVLGGVDELVFTPGIGVGESCAYPFSQDLARSIQHDVSLTVGA
jgi:acetate kinase